MYRFRLRSATIAVQQEERRVAMIPTGAEIAAADLPDIRNGFDRSKFVTVEWDGMVVRIFLLDLLERGERLERDGSGGRTQDLRAG